MTTQDILDNAKKDMQKVITAYQEHLMKIRTGRANANMLDSVKVMAYGTLSPLNQVANVSAPEPQLIMVKPYDKSQINEIVSGIQKADLGLNPIADAEVVRVPVPPLTEEVRKDAVKRMYKELENYKIQIRNARRDAMDAAKKEDTQISEDMVRDLEKQIQELTNSFTKELDDMSAKKESSLMTI